MFPCAHKAPPPDRCPNTLQPYRDAEKRPEIGFDKGKKRRLTNLINFNSSSSDSPITTGCLSVTNAVAKTSPALRLFIREVREARTELDAVLAELHSLAGVIDILKDDANSFPLDLAQRTPPVLEHCTSILNQIDGYMHVCNGIDLSKRDKRFRWLAIRADMVKLRLTLEGYKSILALVTDLVGLYVLVLETAVHALADST